MLRFQDMPLKRQYTMPSITPPQAKLSWDNMICLTDRHIQTVQAWLSTRSPQAKRFAGIGLTATSTGLAVSLLNLVLGCNYPPGTKRDVIDREIETVKAFFADRGVPWSWWVGPRSSPVDIGRQLEQHGLKPETRLLPALVAPLPTRHPSLNSAAQVWRATTLTDLEAASTIRRIAFSFPYATALHYFESMAEDWLNDPDTRLYLARLGDGAPAAIGAMIVRAGMPGVYVMATLPEWSRRGLGSAILARILAEARAEGYRLIALTASQYGYPLYRRFGFEPVFDYTIYNPEEQQPG